MIVQRHGSEHGNQRGLGQRLQLENTSYFMPAYYRVFYEFSGDSYWSKAADDAVAIWYANHNSNTGLIANEVNQYGAVGTTGEDYVDYNGCRIPWRAAADYLWYGTADVKTITDTMSDWIASTMGIASFLDGYDTNGNSRGGWNGSGLFHRWHDRRRHDQESIESGQLHHVFQVADD